MCTNLLNSRSKAVRSAEKLETQLVKNVVAVDTTKVIACHARTAMTLRATLQLSCFGSNFLQIRTAAVVFSLALALAPGLHEIVYTTPMKHWAKFCLLACKFELNEQNISSSLFPLYTHTHTQNSAILLH